MKHLSKNNKVLWGLGLLVSMVIIFLVVKNNNQENKYVPIQVIATNSSGQNYVGYAACTECHKNIVESHLETAHFKTSALSNKTNIKGSFNEASNTYKLNDDVIFKMVSNENGQFQEAYDKRRNAKVYALKFDINVGSATKGQSYLTWLNGGLYQQQVSYYSPSNSWINSPMYPKERFVMPRPIIPQCIGCHATYAKTVSNHPEDNRYIKDQIVLGIDCERCHGPAEEHILLARKNKLILKNKAIISFNDLNRHQRLDACALCHSGLTEKTRNGALNYTIGDKLVHDENEVTSNEDLDVHGNQYGLIIQSMCFKKSKTLDCITCHDVHKNERGQSDKFNKICMSCHQKEHVQHENNLNDFSKLDCINCHMPVKSSRTLLINNTQLDTTIPLQVRSHHIKVY